MTTTDRPPHDAEPMALTGYLLRCHLVLALRDAKGVMTVADLVAELGEGGLVTRGRASKDVSDALRWEVRRGRVRQVARGSDVVGRLPRQTAWRMRRRLDAHLAGRSA